jgi:hypothetical protein
MQQHHYVGTAYNTRPRRLPLPEQVAPEVRMGRSFPLWRGAVAAAATYYIASFFVDVPSALGLAGGAALYTFQWQQLRVPTASKLPRYGASIDTALPRSKRTY